MRNANEKPPEPITPRVEAGEALETILQALRALTPIERNRVLGAARMFYRVGMRDEEA